jgi:hypothetical protein
VSLDEAREGAAFQVQSSRDGETWINRQPPPDGVGALVHGGDHWYSSHHEAWVAANHLRNTLTWSAVRIVVRDRRGNIAGTVPVA